MHKSIFLKTRLIWTSSKYILSFQYLIRKIYVLSIFNANKYDKYLLEEITRPRLNRCRRRGVRGLSSWSPAGFPPGAVWRSPGWRCSPLPGWSWTCQHHCLVYSAHLLIADFVSCLLADYYQDGLADFRSDQNSVAVEASGKLVGGLVWEFVWTCFQHSVPHSDHLKKFHISYIKN